MRVLACVFYSISSRNLTLFRRPAAHPFGILILILRQCESREPILLFGLSLSMPHRSFSEMRSHPITSHRITSHHFTSRHVIALSLLFCTVLYCAAVTFANATRSAVRLRHSTRLDFRIDGLRLHYL